MKAPTLLIVGALDDPVIRLNEEAYAELHCEKELKIVPDASHPFEEPGALAEVTRLAAGWFRRHLQPRRRTGAAETGAADVHKV